MRLSMLPLFAPLAFLPATAFGQTAAPVACSSAEHGQFDFWLGEWEVRGAAGRVAVR